MAGQKDMKEDDLPQDEQWARNLVLDFRTNGGRVWHSHRRYRIDFADHAEGWIAGRDPEQRRANSRAKRHRTNTP